MAGVNKVILVGNVGSKPELKYTSSGVPFCNFSVATNERWGKDEQGQNKEHTEWHRLTAWRKTAEICAQYLDKGKQVYIEGKLRTRQWTTQEGEKRYTTEIQIDEMTMLGSGRGGGGGDFDVPDSAYEGDQGYTGGGGGGFGGDRGAGAFRKETVGASSFPGNGNGNGNSSNGRAASAGQAPEVIDLDKLDDNEFF